MVKPTAEFTSVDNPKITVHVPDEILNYCSVKSRHAEDLSIDETRSLIAWCDCQDESYWDGLTLQEILNVYRISAEYDTFEGWHAEEERAAVKAWNDAVINTKNLIRL